MTSTRTPLTFSSWTAALAERGLSVLPPSHPVPVELWARDADGVVHFRARGTTVTLRRYQDSDLTGLILRSECDCAEHRTAGAGTRTVLAPGAAPVAEVQIDGAAEFGWRAIEAGRLDVPAAAVLFDLLHERLGAAGRSAATEAAAVA